MDSLSVRHENARLVRPILCEIRDALIAAASEKGYCMHGNHFNCPACAREFDDLCKTKTHPS